MTEIEEKRHRQAEKAGKICLTVIMEKNMAEDFDYRKAVEELESIAAKVEDPKTGVDDIGRYVRRSQELIEACRAYLRGAREKLEQ